MSREFPEVRPEDYIDSGLLDLLKRDLAALTTFSGEGAPTNAPEGAFYNDLKNKTLSCNGETIINYKAGMLNKDTLERKYQPLNAELTQYSNVTPLKNSLISKTSVLAITSYFTSLNLANLASFKSELKLGNLAAKNKVSTNDIANQTISINKFKEPFRTKKLWKVDWDNDAIDVDYKAPYDGIDSPNAKKDEKTDTD